MNSLLEAIRFKPPQTYAFVGSGGKTSSMFELAKLIGSRVLVTTTTHIGTDQIPQQFEHVILQSERGLPSILERMNGSNLVVTGPAEDPFRFDHPGTKSIDLLHQAALEHGYSMLIEADGSRTLPLKAPAEHEPAIPPWVTGVVVCVGASGFGKPLSDQIAHRMDIFSELSGLTPGDSVTMEAVARVLQSTQGGLKSIPAHATRHLLINQADDPIRQGMAGRLAELCLSGYERVLITSLQAKPSPLIHARYEPVAGIVLAAGGSIRLGTPKQLVRMDGVALVRRIALIGLRAGLSPLLVVVGSDAQPVSEQIADLPVTIIRNDRWPEGQSTSIKAGVASLPENTGGAVFLLSDQPYLSEEIIRALISEARSTGLPVIAPLIEDQRGNPVYFDRDTLADLSHLTGDQGGRAIFTRYPPHYLPWGDEKLLLDIDTPQDLKKISHG